MNIYHCSQIQSRTFSLNSLVLSIDATKIQKKIEELWKVHLPSCRCQQECHRNQLVLLKKTSFQTLWWHDEINLFISTECLLTCEWTAGPLIGCQPTPQGAYVLTTDSSTLGTTVVLSTSLLPKPLLISSVCVWVQWSLWARCDISYQLKYILSYSFCTLNVFPVNVNE